MSLNQPARCLIRASTSAATKSRSSAQPTPSRSFHQSSSHNIRRRRLPYSNLKADELAEINEGAKKIRGYTKEEWKAMKLHYTPAQIESIRQGEKAIDPRDLVTQGGIRSDPWRIKYVEDFRVIDPLVDNQPNVWPTHAPKYFVTEAQDQEFSDRAVDMMTGGMDPRSIEQMIEAVQKNPVATQKAKDFAERFREISMTDHEITAKRVLRKLLRRLETGASLLEGRVNPSGSQTSAASAHASAEEVTRFFDATGLHPGDELSLLQTADKDAFRAQLNDPRFSSLAPKIPRFNDPRVRFEDAGDEASAADTGLARLALMTGQPIDVLKKINTKELVYRRVVNQTRMGKIASSSILCIAGNGNGLIGIGEGKSTEASDARIQAQMGAIRNMKPILRYEDRTIFGEVEAKVGATEVELSSRPPGFGVRCQHLIFEVCKLAGIHDLSARVVRSRNPMNTVKATFEALTKQRLPEDVARARGKKLVDVRKVYYAGAV